MANKRANNEGTVFKTKNNKWRAQVTLSGKRLSYTADTKRECLVWIRKTKNQIDKGLTIRGAEMTLARFMDEWLVSVAASRTKSTLAQYHWLVNKRILPYLGRAKLKDLRPDQIQSFYDFLLNREGRSAHQVQCIHKALRSSMSHAVNLGYLSRNPVAGTTPPKPKKKEMGFYDDQQVQIFLDTALAIEDRFHPLYYLAIHTGMRQAELIGLKWSDVNWENNTISVGRQVRHFKGGSYTFTPPKSNAGKRTIILGQQALDVLKNQMETVAKLREVSEGNWTELDLIFPSIVGTPVTASNVRRAFRRLIEVCDLPKIRFHDLRHTAASLMLNHGIPVLIASRRLGHSKPSITMDVYGHLMPNKQEEAAHLLDKLMNAN